MCVILVSPARGGAHPESKNMNWQILIIVSVIFASLSTILQRILLKNDKSDPVAYSIFFQLLVGMFIGSVGFFTGQMNMPRNLLFIVPNLILMTLLYGVGNVFLFKALKQINASIFTVVFSSRALFTVIASTIFLSETLLIKQFFGVFLILAGIVLVSSKATKFNFGKGEIFAILAALCFGFANTNDRFLLKTLDVYPYVFLVFIVPALFILGINLNVISKIKVFTEKIILSKMIFLCVFYALSAITFFYALRIGNNSSQIATINLTSVILTVLLSVLILREREDFLKKIIAALLSFVGLILVS